MATTSIPWGSTNNQGHLIKVTAGGKSSYSASQANPAKLFFPVPKITKMEGDMTTKGGQTLQATGDFFGPVTSTITVTIGGLSCTDVKWKSDKTLELVTPPMSGSGASIDMDVVVTAGSQSSDLSFKFTYTPPTLTSIEPLAQKPTGTDGIPMTLKGKEFADVPLDQIKIEAEKDGGGGVNIPCSNIQRVDYETLTCMYPDGGAGGCTDRNVYVTVAGRKTVEKVPLCYRQDAGSGPLSGVPATDAISEGGAYTYNVQLATASTGTTTVEITSSNTMCTPEPTTLSFTISDGTTAKTITIQTTDDGLYTTQDTAAYICDIQHVVTSADSTSLGTTKFQLTSRSKGCGVGEYFGKFDRGVDGTQCVCSPPFFIAPNHPCIKCPVKESICDDVGLHAPVIKNGFWRSDPTSPNLTTVPFYSCPYPNTCLGGNATDGSCADGHDESGPVCAVCLPGYSLQGEQCTSCPNYNVADGPPLGVYISIAVASIVGLVVFIIILRSPALSKKDEKRIIGLIKSEGVTNLFDQIHLSTSEKMDIENFTNAMAHLRASLAESQMKQLYSKIDADNSGVVSYAELNEYINPRKKSASDELNTAKENKDSFEDKQEKNSEVDNRFKQLGGVGVAITSSNDTVGTVFMKIKLLVGFGQVLSYYPVVFGKSIYCYEVIVVSFLRF
jgi:hypothetical protein